MFKSKICSTCKIILDINHNWYYKNDRVYCSNKCRKKSNKYNIKLVNINIDNKYNIKLVNINIDNKKNNNINTYKLNKNELLFNYCLCNDNNINTNCIIS